MSWFIFFRTLNSTGKIWGGFMVKWIKLIPIWAVCEEMGGWRTWTDMVEKMSLKRHRASSVSFTKSSDPNNVSNPPSDDEDNIQISLAPRIQTYLARASQRKGCCGRCLPIPFERAARNSWCDPHFDSEILEGQYKQSAFPQLRLRFR